MNDRHGKEVCGPGFDFQASGDLEVAVKEDVSWLKGNAALVDGTVVGGWVYGVEDGKVKQIV